MIRLMSSNLAQRVVTALTLVAGLLLLLVYGSHMGLAAVLFVVGILAVWELWRLVQAGDKGSLLVMVCCFSACAVQFWIDRSAVWVAYALGILGLLHAVITVLVLKYKPSLKTLASGVYGSVLLAAVVFSVLLLREAGFWVLMSALLMVWATDVGGYFFGKGFGGKWVQSGLAPQISPKKSWEGALGGVVLATLVAWVFQMSPARAWVSQAWVEVLFLTALVAAYSITGDLVESLLKRQAEVKDSSQLLPGHGGILDRIDALIPILPLCAAWVSLRGQLF